MTKHIQKSKDFITKPITKRYVSFAFVFFIALLVSYVTVVGQTVFATVARKSSMIEAKDKMAEVAYLEVEYIQKSKTLTKEKAYELGLTDAKSVSYAKDAGGFSFVTGRENAF